MQEARQSTKTRVFVMRRILHYRLHAMRAARFWFQRLITLGTTLLIVTFITFVFLRVLPGDAASALGERVSLSGEGAAAWRRLQGLDEAWPIHYLSWVRSIIHLDFGYAYMGGRAVREILWVALPKTLALTGSTVLVVYGLAIPLGFSAAVHRKNPCVRWLQRGSFLIYSIPSFWTALLLLTLLASAHSGILPMRALHSPGAEEFGVFHWFVDALWHLLLPVFCLSYAPLVRTIRYQRAAVLDVLNTAYVRAARARGLSGFLLLRRHVLRNSLIPLATLFTLDLPWIVGGSVVIERIFSIRGMGLIMFEAVLRRDLPVIMGVVTVICVSTVLALACGDLLLQWLSPRARRQEFYVAA